MTERSAGLSHRPEGAEKIAVYSVAGVSLGVYAYIFLPFLPKADNFGGSDYSYFLPQLLAGYYWFLHNGPFSVPWFTPAFCAGMPYYGNMQGMYFSLPQFLTFVIGPTKALQVTFLAFAAVGFGGFCALLRKVFGIAPWVALAGGVLFLFNSFFAARFINAHLTFHAFMLVPFLAVCVFAGRDPGGRRPYIDAWMLFGALILAYMVQSGMVHALPPSLFGIGAIVLVHGYIYGVRAEPFVRLLVMGCIALLISAAKLAAGMAFLSQFPRDMIPLSGFGSIWQSLGVVLQALFIKPPFYAGAEWLQNNQWFADTKVVLSYHEYEYGVSYIPGLIILAWFVVFLVTGLRRRIAKIGAARLTILALMGFLLALPVMLNWYEPGWNGFLKSLPLLNNSSTLIRWITIYIPLVILFSVLIIDRAGALKRFHPAIALVIIASVMFHNSGIDRDYYAKKAKYDFTGVQSAYGLARDGAPVPTVSRVEWPRIPATELMLRRDRNDAMMSGGTNAQCYEPMFGHRMEDYPYTALREGPTLRGEGGLLNIKNPACMQYPDANECRPGDHFNSTDLAAATDFVNYRPFPFKFPWWQKLANLVSLVSFVIVLVGLAAVGARRIRAPRRRRVQNA